MGRLGNKVNELTEKYEEAFEEFSNKLKEMEEKQKKSYQSIFDRLEVMSQKIDSQENNIQNIWTKANSFGKQDLKMKPPKSVNIQRNTSDLQKLRQVSQKFATATSFYGLTHIVKAESGSMKLIWTLTTLVSLLFGLIIVVNSIEDFYNYDVFTHTKRLYPESSILPAVTLCSDKSTDFNTLIHEAKFMSYNFSTDLAGIEFHETNLGNAFYCKKFNNFKGQADNQGFHFVQEAYGHLHLNINLNLSFHDVEIFLSDNYLNILEWSQLATGFGNRETSGRYVLEVTESIERKLEEPYNDCIEMADETYRQANCLAQCKNNRAVAEYNCTLENYFFSPGYRFCEHGIREFDSECLKQCPKECVLIKFDSVLVRYESTRNKESFLEIDIFFSDISYFEISQTPKVSRSALVSSIGGALGLFIGIRFLSLVELFEYLADIFFVFYGKHT